MQSTLPHHSIGSSLQRSLISTHVWTMLLRGTASDATEIMNSFLDVRQNDPELQQLILDALDPRATTASFERYGRLNPLRTYTLHALLVAKRLDRPDALDNLDSPSDPNASNPSFPFSSSPSPQSRRAAPSANPQHQSPLFGSSDPGSPPHLPYEVRCQIYTALAAVDTSPIPAGTSICSARLALLHTCRRLHTEAGQILHGTHTFSAVVREDDWARVVRWLAARRAAGEPVRHLVLRYHPDGVAGWHAGHAQRLHVDYIACIGGVRARQGLWDVELPVRAVADELARAIVRQRRMLRRVVPVLRRLGLGRDALTVYAPRSDRAEGREPVGLDTDVDWGVVLHSSFRAYFDKLNAETE